MGMEDESGIWEWAMRKDNEPTLQQVMHSHILMLVSYILMLVTHSLYR